MLISMTQTTITTLAVLSCKSDYIQDSQSEK